LNNIDLFILAN